MKIVADRQIPGVSEAFSTLGEVVLFEGRAPAGRDLRDAELLVIRTVTRVDDALLDGSRVKLVAAASSGTDHVDGQCLARRGIALVSAPGCNARPVAEYVLSALCVATEQRGMRLRESTVGIIGCGHTGSMVRAMLREIGVECVINDPPLAEAGGSPELRPLKDILEADAVTLHVPLTRTGRHRTYGMIDGAFLESLRPGTVLVNAARGEIIDEKALRRHLVAQRGAAVIDVWSNEPDIDADLFRLALIGTPHIAGYSRNAKWRATEMVYRGACAVAGTAPTWSPPPQDLHPRRRVRMDDGLADEDAIEVSVLAGYDVRSDAIALQGLPGLPATERGACFAAVRDGYAPRAEFTDLDIELGPARPLLAAKLAALGFRVATGAAAGGQSGAQ